MLVTIIILSVVLVVMSMMFIRERINCKKSLDREKSKYQKAIDILSDDNNKEGYYDESFLHTTTQQKIEVRVYVEETDKFVNGESEIKFIKSEFIKCPNEDRLRKAVKDIVIENFISVKKTSNITWLISEEDIKELRRKKLEAIKNLNLKNEE